MIEIVDFDSDLRRSIAGNLPDDLLPTAHPSWFDVLANIGEDVRGIAAVRGGRVEAWLTYAVSRQGAVTVLGSLPYLAYAGFYAADAATSRMLLARYREIAEEQRADVASIGTSPLLTADDERTWREAFRPTHELENFVQLHDLQRHPLESLAKKRRDAFLSEIRRAPAAGWRVVSSLTAAQLEAWLKIYKDRYREIGATPYPDSFHRAAHTLAVPSGAAEVWGVLDGEACLRGAVLFLVSRREVTYFSSAFDEEGRRLQATTFLLDQAFRSFIGRGIRMFNWQSSPGRGGVFRYKKRWGAREHRHLYLAALLRTDSALFTMRPDAVRAAFPLRFVLPFSAWTTINPDAG